MRKILSGFLATSMIVAVASSVTFASEAAVLNAALSGSPSVAATTSYQIAASGDNVKGTWTATVDIDSVALTLNRSAENGGPVTISIPVNQTLTKSIDIDQTATAANEALNLNSPATFTVTDYASKINGATFRETIDRVSYSGKVVMDNAGKIVVKFNESAAIPNVTSATLALVSTSDISFSLVDDKAVTTGGEYTLTGTDVSKGAYTAPTFGAVTGTFGAGEGTADTEKSGVFTSLRVADVVYATAEGDPIPLTEKLDKVDEDQNSDDGVQGSKTLYFMIRSDDDCPVDRLEDDTYWKLKITKGDNGKYVKAISDVTKIFSKGLYEVGTGVKVNDTVNVRRRYIKVELNDIYTDDEYKITLDMRLSAKSKAEALGYSDDSEIKVKDFSFYMKNLVKDADNDWKVGIDGLMLNPLENDWNDVTYYDEDGDVAHMKFFADSDVGKFYSKLSTKWEHADYASYFNDQDAFIFNFTGSPKLSSTSRADLEIYNPFIDEDGNETIDPATATVYQVIDGDLFDVTDSFKYAEGANGDMAFVTRTRFLGTYIICEKPVEEAVSDETVPDTELTPDDNAGAPEETTPDNNGGGKAPANTGKYL